MRSALWKTIWVVLLVVAICVGLVVLIPMITNPPALAVTPTTTPIPVEETPTISTEPTSEPTPTETPIPTSPAIAVDTTSNNSLQKVVTKDEALPEDYVPETVTLAIATDKEIELQPEAADALEDLFQAAENVGIRLSVISGYRSFAYQRSIYWAYCDRDGQALASRYSAYPGHSEHQLGLAVDLWAPSEGCKLRSCFANTEAYAWLENHSYQYGYILRYPNNTEDITGYIFEPWHYRYLGVEEATKVYRSGLTLEEFYGE